ncbi:lysozyme inhibitor LprI family protein [Vibrio sp. Isolate30]|uniref:lysozyme inhibitor LprI family protein n=1 Tax=Vibrio sp. Isolate30 TaxID=2908536 RepID=UPI001EFD10EC|nr:lysozyme inhibitor LprI family protein [Vibrio sp. Isolate30]MCG9633363.1 DUF1311 domain-containing protein [Vibrio sp. Isolate30]
MLPTTSLAQQDEIDCENAMNTLEINQCAAIELQTAEQKLETYLQASFEHNAEDPILVDAIKRSQVDWSTYMTAHCDAIYTQWRGGSIRGVMALSCKTELTKDRTHQIWANFLTYMDSTPPVLPEPKVSSD